MNKGNNKGSIFVKNTGVLIYGYQWVGVGVGVGVGGRVRSVQCSAVSNQFVSAVQ